jgi:hypothetical protein
MNIKHLFFAALALLISINAFPQKLTPSPAVDSGSFDETSAMLVPN